MKLRTIIDAVGAFAKLANSDMSLRSAYRLQKLTASIQNEADFFNAKRQKIIEKYAVDDVIPDDKLAEAQVELDKLLDVEVQADFVPLKLPLSENINISVNDIVALAAFVIFEEEEMR